MTYDEQSRPQSVPAGPGARPAKTTLLRNGSVYSSADPFATALITAGETVAWIGSEGAAEAHVDSVDEVVDLRGALVTPAFVDAHVHTTMTGLARTGLDLTGCTSAADLLDRVAARAAELSPDAVVLGHGWDETHWTGAVPEWPTPEQLDRAAQGRKVYLSRIDVHSALVSATLLAAVPEAAAAPGYTAGAPLAREAHHAVRVAALASITADQREGAQLAALHAAAELGIGSVHECGGPQISSEEDFTALLALARREAVPAVFGYWGELTDPVKAYELGAVGAGGDLFIDGAIGSHTACLRAPYADAEATGLGAMTDAGYAGTAYLSGEEIAAFIASCVESGVQPGFHVIGDFGLDLLIGAAELAGDIVGEKRLREVRLRAEHVEMPDARHIKSLAKHGIAVSAQPGFDAAWGGPGGMYEIRLGAERAGAMNPFAALAEAGVLLAFGSDSPVVPLGPWAAVRAATLHHNPQARLSARAAFTAHTRGGWRALKPGAPGVPQDETGVLEPGAPATYAVWGTGDLVVQAPDHRVSAWSTDERSGTPGLPDLGEDAELPACLRTAVRGRTVFDTLGPEGPVG